jgi:hypothetical protein
LARVLLRSTVSRACRFALGQRPYSFHDLHSAKTGAAKDDEGEEGKVEDKYPSLKQKQMTAYEAHRKSKKESIKGQGV